MGITFDLQNFIHAVIYCLFANSLTNQNISPYEKSKLFCLILVAITHAACAVPCYLLLVKCLAVKRLLCEQGSGGSSVTGRSLLTIK